MAVLRKALGVKADSQVKTETGEHLGKDVEKKCSRVGLKMLCRFGLIEKHNRITKSICESGHLCLLRTLTTCKMMFFAAIYA